MPKQKIEQRGEEASTIMLTISREDKLRVKTYALQHDTTVSSLLHEWILQHCSDSDENGGDVE